MKCIMVCLGLALTAVCADEAGFSGPGKTPGTTAGQAEPEKVKPAATQKTGLLGLWAGMKTSELEALVKNSPFSWEGEAPDDQDHTAFLKPKPPRDAKDTQADDFRKFTTLAKDGEGRPVTWERIECRLQKGVVVSFIVLSPEFGPFDADPGLVDWTTAMLEMTCRMYGEPATQLGSAQWKQCCRATGASGAFLASWNGAGPVKVALATWQEEERKGYGYRGAVWFIDEPQSHEWGRAKLAREAKEGAAK